MKLAQRSPRGVYRMKRPDVTRVKAPRGAKVIPLSQGKVAFVDAEDFDRLSKFNWHAATADAGRSFYARRVKSLIEEKETGNRNKILLHHAVLRTSTETQIDHRNRNGLDNRKENLRFASSSNNCANRRRRVSRTGFKGVYWVKSKWEKRKQYQAVIVVRQERKYMGCFAEPVEAARAYDAAALKHFGEFAVINGV